MTKLEVWEVGVLCGIIVAVVEKAVTMCDWFSAVLIGVIFSVVVVCAELIIISFFEVTQRVINVMRSWRQYIKVRRVEFRGDEERK